MLNITDYDASIHRDILDALVREDETVIEVCEDRAIAEMRCYLGKRYDCNKIFAATGENRNQLVLMRSSTWRSITSSASTTRRNFPRYARIVTERAVEWMKAVADEDISNRKGLRCCPRNKGRAGRNFRITKQPQTKRTTGKKASIMKKKTEKTTKPASSP